MLGVLLGAFALYDVSFRALPGTKVQYEIVQVVKKVRGSSSASKTYSAVVQCEVRKDLLGQPFLDQKVISIDPSAKCSSPDNPYPFLIIGGTETPVYPPGSYFVGIDAGPLGMFIHASPKRAVRINDRGWVGDSWEARYPLVFNRSKEPLSRATYSLLRLEDVGSIRCGVIECRLENDPFRKQIEPTLIWVDLGAGLLVKAKARIETFDFLTERSTTYYVRRKP